MRSSVATKPNIGLREEGLTEIGRNLNRLLSDEYVLYTKTRNFHWNVTGPRFAPLHAFFQEQYEQLNEVIDEVAERCRALGEFAFGSLKEFLDNARLHEYPGQQMESMRMISSLMEDHESTIRNLRSDIEACDRHHDEGTSNFLAEVLMKHEKMAWMLRANLEGQ